MPASIVLHVKPTDDCQAQNLDGGIGITSLGKILYQYMKQKQIATPEKLIGGYAFSPLYLGERSPKPFNTDARKGTLCWFRVSSLEEKISTSIFNHLYQDVITEQIPLLQSTAGSFEVVRAISTPSSKHPWVDCTSIENLLNPTVEDDNESLIDFVSATLFLDNNTLLPLPLPKLVFGSLAKTWNRIVPQHTIPEEVINELTQNIVIVLFKNLSTNIHPISNGKLRVGFVGKVKFRLLKTDPQFLRYFNLLSDICFYTGLGQDTNMGCGMTRRIPRGKWDLVRDLLR